MNEAAHRPLAQQLQPAALIAGIAGLALSVVGALFDPAAFFHSYLTAFQFGLSFALGSLAIRMIHHLTGGVWGQVLQPFLRAATGTLPLLLLLAIPLAFGLRDIYIWARPEELHDPLLIWKSEVYFNVPFFLARAAGYFAVWLVVALLLNRWSAKPDLIQRADVFSGPGLVLYGLTVTFAAIDWIMSLEPHWYSTIFGAIVAAGQLLPALALGIVAAVWLMPNAGSSEAVEPAVWNDLGNLLLTFVMMWSYLAFSQLLLIWSGNLPEEISWYLLRDAGGWQWVGAALALFYFVLPFLILLSRDVKRNPRTLGTIALTLVGVSFLQQFWLIVPSFSPGVLRVHWLDLTTLVGVSGVWLAEFLRQLHALPWVAPRESKEEVLHHA